MTSEWRRVYVVAIAFTGVACGSSPLPHAANPPASPPFQPSSGANADPHGGAQDQEEHSEPGDNGIDAVAIGNPGVDCSSPTNTQHPQCQEQCHNGIDDDLNGLTDCDDPACALPCGQHGCAGVEDCLVQTACACTLGVDCPASPEERSACRELCRSNPACSQHCLAATSPDVASAAQSLWACGQSACGSETDGECLAAACLGPWAACALPEGEGECSSLADCVDECSPPGASASENCVLGCGFKVGRSALLDWGMYVGCLEQSCPQGQPSCMVWAEALPCAAASSGCAPIRGSMGCLGTRACLADAATTADVEQCLLSASPSTLADLEPVALCVVSACHSDPHELCALATWAACGAALVCEEDAPPAPPSEPPAEEPNEPCPPPGCQPSPAKVRVVNFSTTPKPYKLFWKDKSTPLSGFLAFQVASPYLMIPAPGEPAWVLAPGGEWSNKNNIALPLPALESGKRYSALLHDAPPGSPESFGVVLIEDPVPGANASPELLARFVPLTVGFPLHINQVAPGGSLPLASGLSHGEASEFMALTGPDPALHFQWGASAQTHQFPTAFAPNGGQYTVIFGYFSAVSAWRAYAISSTAKVSSLPTLEVY